MSRISFDGSRGFSLDIPIPGHIGIRELVDLFAWIRFPETSKPPEQIGESLIELVSNSLRAQHEKGVDEAVQLKLSTLSPSMLRGSVTDKGGGFDPALLPFALDSPLSDFDPQAKTFVDYRRRSGYTRFGLGLVFARMTFEEFRLDFLDRDGLVRPWPDPSIIGTRVSFGLPMISDIEEAHPGGERSEVRERCFARATIEDLGLCGVVADISDSGLRLRIPCIEASPLPEELRLAISMDQLGVPALSLTARVAWRASLDKNLSLGLEILKFADEPSREAYRKLRSCFCQCPAATCA